MGGFLRCLAGLGARSRFPGRGALALVLLALLLVEVLPCAGPDPLVAAGPAASPGLMRLRVCGGADFAPGSLGDQSILRSEVPPPLAPTLLWSEAFQVVADLPDGHPPAIDRPPRPGA